MPAIEQQTNRFPSPRQPRGWPALPATLAVLSAAIAAALAAAALPAAAQDAVASAKPAAVRYRVINLAAGSLTQTPHINASGQVAFSQSDGGASQALFFDGRHVLQLGTLGGSAAYVSGLNDSGQVSGTSARGDDPLASSGAFRWSAATGMLDLGTLDGGSSTSTAINRRGEVVGDSGPLLQPLHAFRWNTASGMEYLGTLSTDLSSAVALNDTGMVCGFSNTASGDAHSFVWTRNRGIEDIGTLGGTISYPVAVGAAGEVAGYSDTAATPYLYHAYLWTRATGMRDLGTLSGSESFVLAMSPHAHIAGVVDLPSGYQHAISWTAASGMLDLGTFGGPGSRAVAVNDKGQVAGWAMDKSQLLRAFSWSRAQGLTDLNKQLVNAPAGLLLDAATAIGDNGAIVASSNAGVVLLRPVGQELVPAPVVGPIVAPALVRAGSAAAIKLAFNDIDTKDIHRVSIDWGDAVLEAAVVNEKNGSGSATASHHYRDPGVYNIAATVTDKAGNATTVKRELVVEAASLRAAGSGRVLAPRGADRHAPDQAGPAAFSFVAPGVQAASGKLSFSTARLAFRSTAMRAASASGQFSGSGTLNGKDGYRYAMTVAAGAGGSGDFGLRIWHQDPVSQAEVVDFDNQQGSASARGTALLEGALTLAP